MVEGAGANLDCLMLPKVQSAEQVVALDLLLTQIERRDVHHRLQQETTPGVVSVHSACRSKKPLREWFRPANEVPCLPAAAEDGGADPHQGRAFFDRHLEIVAHSHRKLRHL